MLVSSLVFKKYLARLALDYTGKTIELEDLEGLIIVYAVIPLFPGMAQWYYEMVEHVRATRKFTVASIVLPYRQFSEDDNIEKAETVYKSIAPNKQYGTILLKETDLDTTPAILEHLMNAKFKQGNWHLQELHLEVVSVYIVASSAVMFQKLSSTYLPGSARGH